MLMYAFVIDVFCIYYKHEIVCQPLFNINVTLFYYFMIVPSDGKLINDRLFYKV